MHKVFSINPIFGIDFTVEDKPVRNRPLPSEHVLPRCSPPAHAQSVQRSFRTRNCLLLT